VLIGFSRLVEHSLVRKQDAWKEAGIHIDPMQHISIEVWSVWLVWLQFLVNLHFVHKQMQPLVENSMHCRTWYMQFRSASWMDLVGLLQNAVKIL
jgi:hypothetical protein